jgi:hypothetical protein
VLSTVDIICIWQEATHPGALQRHTGTPADLRVGTAVALSSVAKYWVLTNLFPGPIPQVSVYGLHPPRVSIFKIRYIYNESSIFLDSTCHGFFSPEK